MINSKFDLDLRGLREVKSSDLVKGQFYLEHPSLDARRVLYFLGTIRVHIDYDKFQYTNLFLALCEAEPYLVEECVREHFYRIPNNRITWNTEVKLSGI